VTEEPTAVEARTAPSMESVRLAGPPSSGIRAAETTDRWLARTVLGAGNRLVEQLPPPVLVSAHLGRAHPAIRGYVSWWIRHADADGGFAKKTWWLRWLPDGVLFRLLTALAYDGIVYPGEGSIIGHVFYQRHGDALHGFSTAVSEQFAGNGYSVVMLLDYVAGASRVPGVARARVGTGRNNTTRRLLERLAGHAEELGWRVTLDGWVAFSR
jgi:hypothetical protein